MNIKCPSCGTTISAEEKFCPECGYPMNRVQESKMFCPSCGSEVSNEEKYCPECGASIKLDSDINMVNICPSCKAQISTDEKFCPECGAPISSVAQTAHLATSTPTQESDNAGVEKKKTGRSFIAYVIGAIALISVMGFGIMMFSNTSKQPESSKKTAIATQQAEDTSKKQISENSKKRNEQVAAILNDLGISGPINGTTYGANPDGFYVLVGKDSILVDLKNMQAARIENPEVFRKLVDARHSGGENIIYPKFLIIKDKPGQDKDLGAWQASNHFIPLYVPVTFDANGNAKVERISSGAGVSPSHYHDVLKEKKNIDLVNLFLKETFPYLDTVAQAMPQEIAVATAPPITKSAIAGASHSSADQEGSYVHSALLAIDGDTKTCWAEGVKGYGIGESITVNFNSTYRVNGMNIWTGHQKTEDLFYKNARPMTVRITGSDGSNDIYNLNDMLGVQRINFRKPMDVNYIKITVEKIAPGNKYEDTCIAEVSFF